MEQDRIYAMVDGKPNSRSVDRKTLNFLIAKMNLEKMIPPDFYRLIILNAQSLFKGEDHLTFEMAEKCYEAMVS